MWGKKKQEQQPEPVETAAQYWAKRDAERDAREAEQKAQAKRESEADDNNYWEGYAAPKWTPSDGDIFNYELSAYTEGHEHADGTQRVCILPRRK